MKIAIVYDSLNEFGGGERVLQAFLELFPEADVYTAHYDLKFIKQFFPSLWPKHVFASWMQNTSLPHHGSLAQFIMPWVWRRFNLKNYDLIISISGWLMPNLTKTQGVNHLQYILCPPKNIFGLDQPFPHQKHFPFWLTTIPAFKTALRSTPYLVAISRFIAEAIEDIAGVKPKIIYPPVDIPTRPPVHQKNNYFLSVSRIDYAKNLELAIFACNKLKLPLKIVGAPADIPYEKFLRSIAGPTIEFLGFQSDRKINQLYQEATAFIFTSRAEDFGIAPVEAMAHGVPVISYYGGGAKETVIKGKTGTFFYKHTGDSLAEALLRFDSRKFSPDVLYQHAKTFSKQKFQQQIRQYLTGQRLINYR